MLASFHPRLSLGTPCDFYVDMVTRFRTAVLFTVHFFTNIFWEFFGVGKGFHKVS